MREPQKNTVLRYPINISQFYGGERNIVSFTACDYAAARLETREGQSFVVARPAMAAGIYMEVGEDISIGDDHEWAAGTVLSAALADSLSGLGRAAGEAASRIAFGATMGLGNWAANKVGGQYLGSDAVLNQFRVSTGDTQINPNTTMVYSNSDVRKLDFNFVMRPESEAEAEEIVNIVSYFTYYSRGSVPRGVGGIRFPYLWYIRTSSESINAILESGEGEDESLYFACTRVLPTMHTDVLYENRYPHRTDLSLSFSEMRVRYRLQQ